MYHLQGKNGLNSFDPSERFACTFKYDLVTDILKPSSKIALRWMPQDLNRLQVNIDWVSGVVPVWHQINTWNNEH